MVFFSRLPEFKTRKLILSFHIWLLCCLGVCWIVLMDRLKMLAQQVREKEKMDKLKREMHTLSINSFLQCQISVKSLNSEQGSHRKKCERSCCSLVLNHELTICDIQWLQHFFTYTLFSHWTISLPIYDILLTFRFQSKMDMTAVSIRRVLDS